MEEPTYLSQKNPHERDLCIVFDEGPHIYTIDGDSDYMSVTTWNHSHFPHFDADAIIIKMMKSLKMNILLQKKRVTTVRFIHYLKVMTIFEWLQ